MGNSESKSESNKSPGATPTRSSHHHPRDKDGQSHASSARRQPPPPPTNSTPLATRTPSSTLGAHAALAASPSISTSEIHGHGATARGTSHSRQRSITAGGNRLKPDDVASSHASDASSTMGQEQSKKAPSRSATHPPAGQGEKERPAPSPEPVQVPPHPPHREDFANKEDLTQPGEAASPYGLPASQFDRPPRLPLPIERDPEPSSPIISPTDIASPEGSDGDGLRRRHSMLSSTTLDDDEEIDAATFNMDHDSSQPKQATTIVWRYPAHQVYITGSFVDWQRKLKMQKDPQTGQHTIQLHLPPGTHHMKFLVDGEMRPSDEYPTTVDFTNALMNYLEIMPQPPAPAAPVPIPGAGSTTQTKGQDGKPDDIPSGTRVSATEDELSSTLQDTLVPAPEGVPAGQPEAATSATTQEQPSKPPKKQLPRPKYTRQIPDMLTHLDLYGDPENENYQRASKAMQNLPTPPTLPMFMQKSILNANTPVKDDASVLTMPNHTILNHLATSSIRSGVLATSGTTRYKRKFLTTIMYKPTSESG